MKNVVSYGDIGYLLLHGGPDGLPKMCLLFWGNMHSRITANAG